MRLVIIESPFGGDQERNRRYLQACIRDCLRRGESPYASHQMLTDALNDANDSDRQLGIRAGFTWRPAAAATVVYTDLGTTDGMLAGIRDAERLIIRRVFPKHVIEYRKLGAGWDA